MKISSKKIDAKPHLRSEPPKRVPYAAKAKRAKKQLAALKTNDMANQSGNFTMADRTPRGRKSAIVFGAVEGFHLHGSSPAYAFAYAFRRALGSTLYAKPPVKVYGPDGETVIATIDPITRKRTPVNPS